jgi:hypothetical protein
MKTKHCNWCNSDLEISAFGKDKSQKDGFTFYCRSCINAYNREHSKNNENVRQKSKNQYHSNKRRHRDWELKRTFGITIEDYEHMLVGQNGLCAICIGEEQRKHKTLSVDHDHCTDAIRGLLCSNCNLGLGNFQDSIELLESAIRYLKVSQNNQPKDTE